MTRLVRALLWLAVVGTAAASAVPKVNSCSLDADCAPAQYCSQDGMCVARDLLTLPPVPTFERTEVIGIAVALGVLTALLFVAGALWCIHGYRGMAKNVMYCAFFPDGDEVTKWMLGVILVSSFVGFGVGVISFGLIVGYDRTVPMPPAGQVAAANCSSLWALSCAPYSCDLTVGHCRTACNGIGECETSYQCTNGLCAPSVPGRTVPFPWWGALLIAVAVGLIPLAIGYMKVTTKTDRKRGKYVDRHTLKYGAAAGGFLFLLIGIILLAARPQVKTNEFGAQTEPGVSHGQIPAEGAAFWGFLIPVIVVGCPLLMCGLDMVDDDKSCRIISVGTVVSLLFCASIIGIPLAVADRPVDWTGVPVGSGAQCKTGDLSTNMVCTPYFCDGTTSLCRTSCVDDTHCMPGYQCFENAGARECLTPEQQVAQHGAYEQRILPGWTAALISLGVCVVVALLCAIPTCCGIESFFYPPFESLIRRGTVTSLCVGLACAVIVGFSIGFSQHAAALPDANSALKASDPPVGCAMRDAVACEPYKCNTGTNVCAGACAVDRDCMESTMCVDGVCQPNESFEPHGRFKYPVWLSSSVGALIGVVLLPCVLFTSIWLCLGDPGNIITMTVFFDSFTGSTRRLGYAFLFAFLVGGIALTGGLTVGLALDAARASHVTQISCQSDANACAPGYTCQGDVCVMVGGPKLFSPSGATGIAFSAGFCVLFIVILVLILLDDFFEIEDLNCKYPRAPCESLCSKFCTGCMFGVAAVVILGLILGTAKITPPPLSPAGILTVNITASANESLIVNGAHCVGALASKCQPYYCDVAGGYCRLACASDDDCVVGYGCTETSECVPVLRVGPYHEGRWTRFALVISILGSFVLSCCYFSFCCGARCRLPCSTYAAPKTAQDKVIKGMISKFNLAQRVDLRMLPFCGVTPVHLIFIVPSVLIATAIATRIAVGGIYTQHNVAVSSVGTGAGCGALWHPICAPYSCDVLVGRCQQTCAVDAECAGEYICDAATHACALETSSKMATTIGLIVLFTVLVCMVMIIYPMWLRQYTIRELKEHGIDFKAAQKEMVTDAVNQARQGKAIELSGNPDSWTNMGSGVIKTGPGSVEIGGAGSLLNAIINTYDQAVMEGQVTGHAAAIHPSADIERGAVGGVRRGPGALGEGMSYLNIGAAALQDGVPTNFVGERNKRTQEREKQQEEENGNKPAKKPYAGDSEQMAQAPKTRTQQVVGEAINQARVGEEITLDFNDVTGLDVDNEYIPKSVTFGGKGTAVNAALIGVDKAVTEGLTPDDELGRVVRDIHGVERVAPGMPGGVVRGGENRPWLLRAANVVDVALMDGEPTSWIKPADSDDEAHLEAVMRQHRGSGSSSGSDGGHHHHHHHAQRTAPAPAGAAVTTTAAASATAKGSARPAAVDEKPAQKQPATGAPVQRFPPPPSATSNPPSTSISTGTAAAYSPAAKAPASSKTPPAVVKNAKARATLPPDAPEDDEPKEMTAGDVATVALGTAIGAFLIYTAKETGVRVNKAKEANAKKKAAAAAAAIPSAGANPYSPAPSQPRGPSTARAAAAPAKPAPTTVTTVDPVALPSYDDVINAPDAHGPVDAQPFGPPQPFPTTGAPSSAAATSPDAQKGWVNF